MAALSHRERLPSRVKANSKPMADSSRQAFPAYCLRVMAHCIHTREIHRMRPVLAVTEPTALPTAMSAFPSKAENSDTSSSGMVVAKLTTVAPMINFGMPVDSAIHVAASTNRSPPFMIQNRPAPNRASTKNRLLPVRSSGMDDPSNDCFCRGPQAIGSKILQT